MDCLTNFIGISSRCSGPASKSGLYIEDIEGFSVKSLSLIEGGKYLTTQALVDRKMSVAGQKILDMISGLISGIYVEAAVDSIVSKSFDDEYYGQQDGNPGLRIEKYPTSFSKLYLTNLYFKSHTAVQQLQITVTDGFNPQVFTIDAAADEEVVIEVNYSTLQRRIDVTYSSDAGPSDTGVSPYYSDISFWNNWDLYTRDCTGCNPCAHRYLRVRGIDFGGQEKSTYYGIRADVSLNCDKEKMICLIAPQYKTMFLYALAIEILNEWAASDRFNFLAMGSKDWAKEKKAEFENKVDYLWSINSEAIKNLIVHSEKNCFTCTGYQYYERIP